MEFNSGFVCVLDDGTSQYGIHAWFILKIDAEQWVAANRGRNNEKRYRVESVQDFVASGVTA